LLIATTSFTCNTAANHSQAITPTTLNAGTLYFMAGNFSVVKSFRTIPLANMVMMSPTNLTTKISYYTESMAF
jgi:hypothetical protein